MGRPCTKCPSTTVQSCCGLRNLRVASLMIGFFKLFLFASVIIGVISVMSGHNTGNEHTDNLPTGQLVLLLLIAIGFLFLICILLAGIFKKRRNYVMIYWVANGVWIILTLIGLFTSSQGVLQWILAFCYVVVDIYFQIVIRSYFLEMTGAAAPNPEAPSNPPPAYPRY